LLMKSSDVQDFIGIIEKELSKFRNLEDCPEGQEKERKAVLKFWSRILGNINSAITQEQDKFYK